MQTQINTIPKLQALKAQGEKIACLTAYDASFAALLAQVNIDVILVGDSLGMVIQGSPNTLSVQVNDMVYHTQAVRRGASSQLIISDLPFMSYSDQQTAKTHATQLMQAGANMVKLEGGGKDIDATVQCLTRWGIPVCAHLGLTPQSVHTLGGYKVQGKSSKDAERILQQAQNLEQAGAALLVLECVPPALAKTISDCLTIPIIGIGAGKDCDGQVLVLYDILGLSPHIPKFAHNFLADSSSIANAMSAYIQAVKTKVFP